MIKRLAFGLTALAIAYAAAPITAAASAFDSIRVGSLTLHRCRPGDPYFCGTVRVAFDPAGQVPGKIDIAFEWLPRTDRSMPAKGTIVAVEGGPGYPSIASRSLYRALYAPLLDTRDMLVVDNRGTGRSAPIRCRALQLAPVMVLHDVTSCGLELGRTADLYGSGIAADDMATILTGLGVSRADMYGDSYGTFFVQAFAGRHPDRVRSLVLDGAYQVIGGSPWYPSEGPTIRSAFNTACARSPACGGRPGTSLDRIGRLLSRLRAAPDPHITPSDLALVMDSAGLDPLAYRDLDAAARAYVENGDRVPLARLVDEAYTEEEGAGGGARGYSQGLFVAVSCADDPQAYDMRLQPPERKAAWQRALARKRQNDPTVYSPFAIDEFLGMPLDYAYVPLCTTWPVASRAHPAGEPVPPGTRFPDVPVLVLNGDLDTITTPAEGEQAARLFRRATHVIVANTGHVTAIDDFYGCAQNIVRRFTASGNVDAGCAARVPAMHLVPSFAGTIADAIPASPSQGNRADAKALRAAAAATLAAADVLSRSYEFSLTRGAGLRGGTYSATPANGSATATLADVRWASDLAVSGTATFRARSASAVAHLVLRGAASGEIDAAWATAGSDAVATLQGRVDGRTLRATMRAP
jgi:pimeloyl-ACP methyl ester carboxylesterase